MNKCTVIIVLISILQLGCFASAEAASTSVNKITEKTGADVARIVKALRQISTDSFDTTIPPAAGPLLTTLKRKLRNLISQVLNSHDNQPINVDDVRKALLAELLKQGINLEKPETMDADNDSTGYTYGDIYHVSIEKIPHHPDLIAATTTIGVCCGTDTSLYIFRKTGQQWELIFAQEAKEYDEVSGAQGSFQYMVSPPSDTGRFFVVTKNVNPWCSSNWQAIRYQVMGTGPTPYQLQILLQQSDSIFIGNENDGIITMLPHGFTIEFDGSQMLDAGFLVRKHIKTYQVNDNQVRRIPPFALEPEDFLDEWFSLPWEEASKWIEPSASSADLRKWHQKLNLNHLGKDMEGDGFSTSFVFNPPARPMTKDEWQVGIEFSPEKEGYSLPTGIPREAYFTIILKDGAYFIKSQVGLVDH